MGEVIVVTSLKGGVGKTVFSSSLAYSFAQQGKRVLAVDMDLATGGLDIALGREDSVLPTLLDLLDGTLPVEESLYPGDDGVVFLSAPVFFNESSLDEITQENFDRLLLYFKENFDAVIFDMPAGGGVAFRFLEDSPLVDLTLLVTTSAPTAVRAAERCAMRLKKPDQIRLVLNCFRTDKPQDNTFGVLEVIRRASVPIIGVVPYDLGAEKALAKGMPLSANKRSLAGKAVYNISKRIFGDSVPLFAGVLSGKRRNRFY